MYSRGEYEKFEATLDGAYTGVGLWARERDGRIEVSRVGSGTPAAEAGIRAGDRLRSVDGKKVDGRPVTEVVSLLRGDRAGKSAGSTVRLGLERGSRSWSETVRRARLSGSRSPSAPRLRRHRRPGVRLHQGLRPAGRRRRARGAEGSGIVLDLRGNPGGLVAEAVTAASAFLDGGLVATYDVSGEQRALHAEPGGDTKRPWSRWSTRGR